MNVLLIHTVKDSPNQARPLPNQLFIPLGISYISSLLKTHGHTTTALVLTKKTPHDVISDAIRRFRPALACLTAVTTEYDFVRDIAQHIKATHPAVYLLAGGPHVSLNPESAVQDPFDAICIGEGEYATLELAGQLQNGTKPSAIENLWIKDGQAIEKNPTRPFNEDLDALPFPDRGIWQDWISDPTRMHTLLLGRGCPFQCTYCCNHALRRLAPGRYVRLRSPDDIVRELEHLLHTFPDAHEVYCEVETISLNLDFAMELCSKLGRFRQGHAKGLSFGTNLRVSRGHAHDQLFHVLRKAGFRFINIGLESGSERVRATILRRLYSNDDIARTVRSARKYGLSVNMYVMVGIPGETLADFNETIECVRQCRPDSTSLSIFFPYPGTELHRACEEQGLFEHGLATARERQIAALDLPGFPRRQIQRQFDWFDYNVKKGLEPRYSLLKGAIYRRLVSTHTYLLPMYRCFSAAKNVLRRRFSPRRELECLRASE